MVVIQVVISTVRLAHQTVRLHVSMRPGDGHRDAQSLPMNKKILAAVAAVKFEGQCCLGTDCCRSDAKYAEKCSRLGGVERKHAGQEVEVRGGFFRRGQQVESHGAVYETLIKS